jgi:hypothetical protein
MRCGRFAYVAQGFDQLVVDERLPFERDAQSEDATGHFNVAVIFGGNGTGHRYPIVVWNDLTQQGQ